MKLKITDARIAFPSIFQPREQLNKEMKYDANFILTAKDRATVAAAIKQVAKDKFGARSDDILKGLEKGRLCLRDGNTNIDKSGDVRVGFKDAFYLVAKNTARPLVIDRDRSPLAEKDGRIYAGCYVNASVELYAVQGQKSGGFGVFASLKGVQFVKDGDSFGGGAPASAEEFDDLAVGAEEALA